MRKLGNETTMKINGKERKLTAVTLITGKDKVTNIDKSETVYIEKVKNGYCIHYYSVCNSYTAATLTTETIEELEKLMETRAKLTPSDIVRLNLKEFPVNCVVRMYNTIRKLYVADDRYSLFLNENCTFTVGNDTYYFNPKGCKNKYGKQLILFKGIDKNGYYVLYSNSFDDKDTVAIEYVPTVSIKNRNYNHYATLLDSNSARIKDMLNSKINGLQFSHFFEVISGLKKYDTCNCPKAIEGIGGSL